MPRRKTHEEFVKEVYDLVGEEYSVLGEYINNKTHIKMKHNFCGYEWGIKPNNFLNGNRCFKCRNDNKRKTTTEFKKEVYSLVKDEYEVIGEYIDHTMKVKMKHNVCGYEFKIIPRNFLFIGNRCPKCAGNIKKTTEEYKQEVYNLVGSEYEILGEYINAKIKILIKHNICGYEYHVSPNKFLLGRRCPKCSGRINYNTETFKKKIYELVGNEYDVLGDYINGGIKILMRHNICNNEYYTVPYYFISGNRCPICNESKGEQKVRKYLEDNNITFKPQYTFNDCKRIECLRFDFAIFNDNNELLYLIEYDGEYHYLPIEGKDLLKYQQENDEIKNKYCEKNNIPLLRIPFWKFNDIETILDNKLVTL